MIAQRQKSILGSIVGEYISTVQPISSKLLEKKYDFGVCPATIRNDMQKLTEEGYLFQPHTSAGRIPTDKAYRFFVDNLMEEDLEFSDEFKIQELLEEKDLLRFASDLLKFASMNSSSLAVACLFDRNFIWKEGWEEVLKEPEFEKRDFVHSFTGFLHNFEKSIDELDLDAEIKVFIGSENPRFRARDFSVITSRCSFPERNKGILALLGPKRMNYNRNIGLMHSLTRLLSDF